MSIENLKVNGESCFAASLYSVACLCCYSSSSLLSYSLSHSPSSLLLPLLPLSLFFSHSLTLLLLSSLPLPATSASIITLVQGWHLTSLLISNGAQLRHAMSSLINLLLLRW